MSNYPPGVTNADINKQKMEMEGQKVMKRCEKERAQSLWKLFRLWHTEEAGLKAMAESMSKHYGHPYDIDELKKQIMA